MGSQVALKVQQVFCRLGQGRFLQRTIHNTILTPGTGNLSSTVSTSYFSHGNRHQTELQKRHFSDKTNEYSEHPETGTNNQELPEQPNAKETEDTFESEISNSMISESESSTSGVTNEETLNERGIQTSEVRNQDFEETTGHEDEMDDECVDVLYKSIDVEVRGHDKAVLDSYTTFVTTAASCLEISMKKEEDPRAVYNRWVVLKSAHVHKKHRVQYEARTFFRAFKFLKLTGSTADTFLEYIQRNLPEGVAMKVTRNRIQSLPQHFIETKEAATKAEMTEISVS